MTGHTILTIPKCLYLKITFIRNAVKLHVFILKITSSNKNRAVINDSDLNVYINFPAALLYGCPFCGVRFSSARTLEGHLTYYCSKKPSTVNAEKEMAKQTQADDKETGMW